jgi:polyisoprenoid-binding protein YceI
MKRIITLFVCLVAANYLIAQELTINSEKSLIEFNYISEGAIGTINGVSGKINFNLSNLSSSSFEGKANISSINTSNKTRDKHLNAPDYFDTGAYPEIIFKSDSISSNNENYLLYGKLTIKDISKSETISFNYEDGKFNGKSVIFSNDYNIHKRKKREDSKILIKITVPVL